jgi:hypothetical protein
MGTPQGLPDRGQRTRTAVAYLVLFLLGVMQGLIGSLQYSQSPAPLVAIILDVVIFATCVFCGWGMRSIVGGLVPAVGWIIASFILSMPSSQGSVIITDTAAGKWYLYGGTIAAVAGITVAAVAGATTRARNQSRSR